MTEGPPTVRLAVIQGARSAASDRPHRPQVPAASSVRGARVDAVRCAVREGATSGRRALTIAIGKRAGPPPFPYIRSQSFLSRAALLVFFTAELSRCREDSTATEGAIFFGASNFCGRIDELT